LLRKGAVSPRHRASLNILRGILSSVESPKKRVKKAPKTAARSEGSSEK
jgi:hypothetical protein